MESEPFVLFLPERSRRFKGVRERFWTARIAKNAQMRQILKLCLQCLLLLLLEVMVMATVVGDTG